MRRSRPLLTQTRRTERARFLLARSTILVVLLISTSASANSPVQADLSQPQRLQLVAKQTQQLNRLEEIKAVHLHPIVESMAMNAINDTPECALALLSIDRKLRAQPADKFGRTALGRAGKKAADLCGVPYAPCVDARIERKLVEGRNRSVLRKADMKVLEICAS